MTVSFFDTNQPFFVNYSIKKISPTKKISETDLAVIIKKENFN